MFPPWYHDIFRMMIGNDTLNSPDTILGRIPEMMSNVPGERSDQSFKKETKLVTCALNLTNERMEGKGKIRTTVKFARKEIMRTGMVLKKQTTPSIRKPIISLRRTAEGDNVMLDQICSE